MAFDLKTPWNSHQIYRVFDDDYSRIFGRPQVNASRIVFLHQISALCLKALADMDDRKVASYRLTRYFLLYCLREILELSSFGSELVKDPSGFIESDQWPEIEKQIHDILVGLVSDFEDDLDEMGEDFDYKAQLKSPNRVPTLARSLIKSYQRDLRRERIDNLDKVFEA